MMGPLTLVERDSTDKFTDLPLPSDAISCGPWTWHGEDDWRRYFLTREWMIAEIWVEVAGEQNHRGELTRWVHISGEDQLDASEQKDLIAAIIEAGRLYDSLLAPSAKA